MGEIKDCTVIICGSLALIALTALGFALIAANLALIVVGVRNLDQCDLQSLIPVWMIVAGMYDYNINNITLIGS